MSKHLVTLIYSKVCGSASRKAVLVAMADRANDDGSSVFVSKSRIAAETELSRSTVISVMQEFEREGMITAIGKRAGNHGYTVIYHMSVAKIVALPDAWSKCSKSDTLDSDLGEEPDTAGQVSDHKTLGKVQVSKSPVSSVAWSDKNRPYRTIDSSSKKKTKPMSVEDQIELLIWEINREQQRNPDLAAQLQLKLTALEQQRNQKKSA